MIYPRFGHMLRQTKTGSIKYKQLSCRLLEGESSVIYDGFVKDGTLIPDLSPRYEQWFNDYTPSAVNGVFYSASLKIYYVVQTGAVMAKGEDDSVFAYLCPPLSSPFFYDEYDGKQYRVVFRNAANGRILTPYAYESFTPEVSLSAAVRHHHRLFGIDADDNLVIRWSGFESSLDTADDINSAGYVRLGGALGFAIGLVSFGASVVILRERGLTAMTALGAPENFKIKDLPLPSAPVVKNTAAVCGDCLYFYTSTGIMKFDGSDVVAVEAPFQSHISTPVCAAGLGGRYILGCGDNAYCYNADTGDGYFIDCPAEWLLNGDTLLAFGNGEAHIIDGGEPSVSWHSGDINFDTVGRKTVTGLYFSCGGTAEVTISNGTAGITFSGSGGYYRTGLSGESFTVTITADGEVKDAVLYAEVCNGI